MREVLESGERTRADAARPPAAPGPTGRAGRSGAQAGLLAPAAVLVGLVVAKATYYAHLGAGLILDDWRLADNTVVYGIGETLHGSRDSVSRPVAWLWFNALYPVTGSSPIRLLVVVTVLNAVVAVLLLVVFARVVPRRLAFAVAAVWVLLPTHTALTVWGAITQALLCMALFLAGVAFLQRGRWLAAALALVAAVFSYQTAVPLVLLAAALVPGDPPLARRDRVKVLVAVAAAVLWSALHPTYPPRYSVPDLAWLWDAHFGAGVFVSESVPSALRLGLALAVLAGVLVAAFRWVRGDRAWASGPSLVLAGVAVWASSLVVLVALPLWIESPAFGIADRVFGLSSVGSAMVLVGLGCLLWRSWRVAAVAAAVVVGAAALSGQYVALHAWSDAGQDAEDLLAALAASPTPPNVTDYAVGPGYPRRNNVVALDADAVYFAHKLRYGGGPGTVTFFEERAAPLDPERFTVWWSAISDDLPAVFYDPLVSVDSVSPDADGVEVGGWAIDRTTREPVGVELWLDGGSRPAATIARADLDRPDVAARFGLGSAHGFVVRLGEREIPPGRHRICAQAVGPRSRPGQRRASQSCVFVTMADDGGVARIEGEGQGETVDEDEPLGQLDAVERTPQGLYLTGWAIDPAAADPTAPVRVAVTVDGSRYGAPFPAAGPRPDLAVWGLGANHGISGPVTGPALDAGRHRVCLVGPLAVRTTPPELDCLSLVVP